MRAGVRATDRVRSASTPNTLHPLHCQLAPAQRTCDHWLQPLDDIHVRLPAGISAKEREGQVRQQHGHRHRATVCMAQGREAPHLGCFHVLPPPLLNPQRWQQSQCANCQPTTPTTTPAPPTLACSAACLCGAPHTRAASAPQCLRKSARHTCPPAGRAGQGRHGRAGCWKEGNVAGRQQGQAGSQRQVAPHFKRGQQANSNRCANASSSSHHHTITPHHTTITPPHHPTSTPPH